MPWNNHKRDMMRDTKEFLNMNSDQLCEHLISFAMSNTEAKDVIEALMHKERYISDYEFRALVDFSKILSDTLTLKFGNRDWTKRIIGCIDIIERANALEMWELLARAWNSLAVSYSNIEMYERAIESYGHALRVEAAHGLCKLSPIIYSNIVLIFMHLEQIDKGLKYIANAIELLEANPEDTTIYWSKYAAIYTTYLYLKIKKHQYDKSEIQPIYDRVMAVDEEKLSYQGRISRLNSKFYYGFFHYKSEEFKNLLQEIKEELGEKSYILYCHESIEFSEGIKRNPQAYIDELIALEERGVYYLPITDLRTYDILMKYYEAIGDEQKLSQTRVKYIRVVKKHLEDINEAQNNAIHTIEELVIGDESKGMVNIENVEFKLIAEETLKTKRKLEKAYERIAIVGELGRKIASTTDLNEVISAIHRMIKEHVPVEFFALMYAEEKYLRSVAVYFQDLIQDEIEIPLDDEQSSFAKCYKDREIIKFNEEINIDSSRFAIYQNDVTGESSPGMISCIFIPLIVAQKVIGVFSIQSSQENAYDGETFEFLREMEPYLAIALNNAVKSMLIEKEIESRKKIQKELEEANAILEQISSMDGLTQISSRRDFEEKFKEMLANAIQSQKSVTVFMLDIDYFKMYNDTYGHFEGDKILKQVAKIFRSNLDAIDGLSARFGGEEFIGAAIGLSLEEVESISKKICDDISKDRVEHSVVPLGYVTASVGAATTNDVSMEIRSDLMRHADECLYSAKSSGKNTFVFKEV